MASSLNEESVEKKLMTVTNTQDSIQSLSLWIIHHKSHHERIVELWSKVLRKSVKPSHRLTLFYLCNDVVQNSKRKKAPVFIETFKQHLKQATALVRQADDEVMPQSKKQRKEKRDMSIKAKVERIFNIWEERQVYDKEFIKEIKAILDGKRADISDHHNKTGHHHNKAQKKPVDPAFSPASVDDMEAIQPADPTLTDLQAEKGKEKEKNTPSPEVLAEFKPQEMVEKIRVYKRLESDIEVKIRQLSHLKLDASSIEAIKQLKDRAHGNEFSTQFEESCLRLEELVKGVEKKQQDQANMLEVLLISEYFYDEQNREARIVANAYKNFGARINSMKRRLDELKKTLPSAPSPIPSPSLDAPSPGNTPPYLDTNTHPVDMDLDTGEEPRLEDDDIPSPPDEAPSPVSSPDDLGVDGKGGSLDNRLASIIPTLKSSSIMKEQPIPVYIPQPLAISSSTPRRPSANKTLTEAELPFPEEEGGGTPLTDETPTTPVMDEQPSVGSSPPPPPPDKKKQKENPIDFLSRLISQTQKSKPTGSSSSFLETFSLLTSKSSEPVGLGSRDGEGSMSPPPSQGPKSWAAWKAQTEKGVDDMAGPGSLASSAGLPPPPLPTFVLAPPPPPSSMSVPPPGPVLPPTMVPPVPPPMASPTFYQHTSPGQKENWPEVQSGTNGAVDVGPPNIVYPPLQEVSPPTFPSISKVPVKGILRKTSHSVLKELTPSSEEIASSVSQLPPPPPPPTFGALSSADIRPPDQPPLGTSAVGSLSMGSGLKDEAEEFMEKLKRKTTVSSVVASYTPNPIRPNLMTLTPGSDGDDGMGEMDMDLDEEDESASEGEVGRPKGIPVLSSVVRRVEHPEKPSREKERLRDGRELSSHEHSSSSSRDPRDAFHKDRHYSRRSSDAYSPGQNYDYRDNRSFGYGPPPAPFFDPYPGNPPYFSGGDPFDAYNYGPPPPKRPYASPSHQRRSNYHHY